ncbi:hypothetical protein OAQ01_05265 [Emcibacteraceae bacterium]|nr:hypothetical protein [Emcibacteraceae bacterium]
MKNLIKYISLFIITLCISCITASAEYNEKILRCEMVMKVDGINLLGPLPSDTIDWFFTLRYVNDDFFLNFQTPEMNEAADFALKQDTIFYTFDSVVNLGLLNSDFKDKNYRIWGQLNRSTLKFTTYRKWKNSGLQEFSGNCNLQEEPKI